MIWLSVKEAACLENSSERTIQRKIEKNLYDYRYVDGIGRGGKRLQIALESLSQKAQDKYNRQRSERICKSCEGITSKQREDANFKALTVKEYQRSGLAPDEFIADFNTRNSDNTITRPQLFRWQNKFKNSDILDLMDRRGGSNKGACSISEDAWQYFYSLYMTQQQRTIQRCWEFTKREFPDTQSIATYVRRVREIPLRAIIFYREGEKAYNDKCLPSMERSRLDIQSNDIWFSDHHRIDVFVKSKNGKRPIRPWLTTFYDARSNKVISHILREADPNAVVVKQCLRTGMEEYGTPNELYFDNGKDYRSKSFSKEFPMSLVKHLNIENIYATKYHGQAKTVERFFETFEDRFGKLFKTYCGRDAKKRPEVMQIPNGKILEIAPSFDEFEKLLDAYINNDYNLTPSRGADMGGKCPNEVYFENLVSKNVVSDHDALRILCGNFEERTVHKNGISLMNNTYFHNALLDHYGERVIVGYDPENIDKINVFNVNSEALCVAEAKIRTAFRNTTDEDYRKARKQKKAANAAAKVHAPARDLDIHTLIAVNQLEEKQFKESEDVNIIENITPQTRKNVKALRESEQIGKRVREEDDIGAILMQKWKQEA